MSIIDLEQYYKEQIKMYQLKLTEQDKQFVLNEAMQYFASKLNNSRGADSIDFSYKIKRVVPVDTAKTTLYIYERAFTKMAMYVMDNRTEIGWHGLARKLENNEGYATQILCCILK